jgi:hypothetical protein
MLVLFLLIDASVVLADLLALRGIFLPDDLTVIG